MHSNWKCISKPNRMLVPFYHGRIAPEIWSPPVMSSGDGGSFGLVLKRAVPYPAWLVLDAPWQCRSSLASLALAAIRRGSGWTQSSIEFCLDFDRNRSNFCRSEFHLLVLSPAALANKNLANFSQNPAWFWPPASRLLTAEIRSNFDRNSIGIRLKGRWRLTSGNPDGFTYLIGL